MRKKVVIQLIMEVFGRENIKNLSSPSAEEIIIVYKPFITQLTSRINITQFKTEDQCRAVLEEIKEKMHQTES